MNIESILIRADVGPAVGTGHVMRSAALGAAWCKLGGRATMVCTANLPGSLKKRLQRMGLEIEIITAETPIDDAVQTRDLAEQTQAAWVVVDGYQFDDQYQQIVKRSLAKLLVIDDFGHAQHKPADLLLNQNIYATPSHYEPLSPETLMLGTKFVLMRGEFSHVDASQKKILKIAKRIMITMGGADQGNFTSTCLQAIGNLSNASEISVDVIAGASNPHLAALREKCRKLPISVRLHQNTDRMSAIIGQCDLAITAGGSTCYELARCGIPAIVISTADNQVEVARSFHESGGMIWLGDSDSVPIELLTDEVQKLVSNSKLRKQMADSTAALVDGQGAQRIARRMLQEELTFRAAAETDSRQLWNWRNEPAVRTGAFQNQEIPWTEHQAWFESTMTDRLVDIWIVENSSGDSIGPVRFNFDAMGTEATISISIAAEFRGQGLGTAIIEAAARRAFSADDIQQIVAWIKPENESSLKAFRKAGFAEEHETGQTQLAIHTVGDQPARKLVLRREQVASDRSETKRTRSA